MLTIHHNGISAQQRKALPSNSTFLHFGTHIPSLKASRNTSDIGILPLTSLYERNGHIITLDGVGGRLRTHQTAVSSPNESRTLDVI